MECSVPTILTLLNMLSTSQKPQEGTGQGAHPIPRPSQGPAVSPCILREAGAAVRQPRGAEEGSGGCQEPWLKCRLQGLPLGPETARFSRSLRAAF